MISVGMTCIHEDWFGRSGNIKVLLQQFDCNVGITDGKE
jgi:hypothetical protein